MDPVLGSPVIEVIAAVGIRIGNGVPATLRAASKERFKPALLKRALIVAKDLHHRSSRRSRVNDAGDFPFQMLALRNLVLDNDRTERKVNSSNSLVRYLVINEPGYREIKGWSLLPWISASCARIQTTLTARQKKAAIKCLE